VEWALSLGADDNVRRVKDATDLVELVST